MADKLQKDLLQILSDFLLGKPAVKPEAEPDWAALFDLAAHHGVAGILFHQCKSVMPEVSVRKHMTWYVGNVVYSILREENTKELARRFEEKGIPAVYIKGAAYRDYYPLPSLRSMGDIDIVIWPEDRKKTDEILKKEMGFDCFVDNHAVWTYWKDRLYIEVHDHMFYENLANQVDYRAYFDHVWEHCRNASVFNTESANIYIPDEDFHFLYLMAHTAKHVINNGSGFRAYLDMVLMVKECRDRLNWDHITGELENLRLLTFTKTCFSCCEKWFGVEMPFRREDLSDSLFAEITDKTFRDGAFGLENAENKPAAAAKDIRRSSSPYFLAAVKRGFSKLFPPYRDMQLVPWYSWIDGKPWLLPTAWIYRFAYCGAKKLKHSIRLISEPFSKKKEVQERQDLMKEWGL